MLSANDVKQYIVDGLACEHVDVRGDDGTHFEAVIVSSEFVGKSMVQQHQLVYKALGHRMQQEIHALGMQTMTPEAWARAQT
jgi:acid stress-induced BolA-like protein IbaG/YrbA